MELTERKLRILQAIISDYVRSAEPVGSRTLSKRFDLGISPATIRNEMSDLEEMGYLTHPHTSAGRVPSDKAYRLYVNDLMEKHELSAADKNFIAERLRGHVNEFEETIKHAAKLLSEITNLTSFAMTPTKNEETLRFINLLPVDERTVVLMIVSESGKISNTAGTFVCNDTLYTLLHNYQHTSVRVGFIHVPYLPEQGAPSLPLDKITEGLTAAIKAL